MHVCEKPDEHKGKQIERGRNHESTQTRTTHEKGTQPEQGEMKKVWEGEELMGRKVSDSPLFVIVETMNYQTK